MLVLSDFHCEPRILPASGGAITLRFEARRTGGTPARMQARYFIDPNESYVFDPQNGPDPRSVFFPPAGSQKAPVPDLPTFSPPKLVSLIPVGALDPRRTQPIRINLELQGYDAAGQPVGAPRTDACDIAINSLGMALGLLKESLDLTNDDLGHGLGVHSSTVGKMLGGGDSRKVRAALAAILRGG